MRSVIDLPHSIYVSNREARVPCKIIFIQDEYFSTENLINRMKDGELRLGWINNDHYIGMDQ